MQRREARVEPINLIPVRKQNLARFVATRAQPMMASYASSSIAKLIPFPSSPTGRTVKAVNRDKKAPISKGSISLTSR